MPTHDIGEFENSIYRIYDLKKEKYFLYSIYGTTLKNVIYLYQRRKQYLGEGQKSPFVRKAVRLTSPQSARFPFFRLAPAVVEIKKKRGSTPMANEIIRTELKEKDVRQWELAAAIRVSEQTLHDAIKEVTKGAHGRAHTSDFRYGFGE